jgi:hypothetical protein
MKDGSPLFSLFKFKPSEKVLHFIIPDDESLVDKEYYIKFYLDDSFSLPNERYLKVTIGYPSSLSSMSGAKVA